MGRRKFRKSAGHAAKPAAPAAAKSTKGKSDELKGVEFGIGKSSDAAAFETTLTTIVRYVNVRSWTGAGEAARALELGEEPDIKEPVLLKKPSKKKKIKDEKSSDPKATVEVDRDEDEYEELCDKYEVSKLRYSTDYKSYEFQRKGWAENKSRMYALVLQCCSTELEGKLKALDSWEQINKDRDVLALMVHIKSMSLQHDEAKHEVLALVESDLRLYISYQQKGEGNQSYYDSFKARIATIDAYDGNAGIHNGMYLKALAKVLKKAGKSSEADCTPEEYTKLTEKAEDESRQKYLAVLFLRISDDTRYASLKMRVHNQWLMKQNAYPETLPAALKLLNEWEVENNGEGKNEQFEEAGVACAQTGKPMNGPDSKVQCFHCGGNHYATYCPKITQAEKDEIYSPAATAARHAKRSGQNHLSTSEDGSSTPAGAGGGAAGGAGAGSLAGLDPAEMRDMLDLLNIIRTARADDSADGVGMIGLGTEVLSPPELLGFELLNPETASHDPLTAEQRKGSARFTLPRNRLYLDSCATYNAAFVKDLLHNVRIVETYLRGNCNAGVTSSNVKGFYGLWDFWLNEKGIANLLSIPQLERQGFVVDYNTKRHWVVTTPQGKEIVFKRDTGVAAGMPYIDMDEHHEAFSFGNVSTIAKNFEGLTPEQVKAAILAVDQQAMVGYPSDQQFKQMFEG